MQFDKITDHTVRLCAGGAPPLPPIVSRPAGCEAIDLIPHIDPAALTQELAATIETGISTAEISQRTAKLCDAQTGDDPGYTHLAARIRVCEMHWDSARAFAGPDGTPRFPTFGAMAARIATRGRPDLSSDQRLDPLLIEAIAIPAIGDRVDATVDYGRDYRFDALGLATVTRALLRREQIGDTPATTERPQDMYMRMALGLRVVSAMKTLKTAGASPVDGSGRLNGALLAALQAAMDVYEALSLQRVSHASPTMYAAGTVNPQLSSCFIISTADDLPSILFAGLEAGLISKCAGGSSICLTPMRAYDSDIRSTGGKASGPPGVMPLIEKIQYYVDQGGRRKGAIAVYLAAWHADVEMFLQMGLMKGALAVNRANTPGIKLGLVVPDRFWDMVEADGDWHLFCPDEVPLLVSTHGAEWEAVYDAAVLTGKSRKIVKARTIYSLLATAQMETGHPYVLNVDAANAKSNLRHLGTTVRSSNLCVAGSTRVLVRETEGDPASAIEIIDLTAFSNGDDEGVEVWNGREWSRVHVKFTGYSRLLRVSFGEDVFLDCTPEHKFYVSGKEEEGVETRADALSVGDSLDLEGNRWPDGIAALEGTVTRGAAMRRGKWPAVAAARTVTSIEALEGDGHPTYCFNEPRRHRGVFNGILTGNCAEILLPSFPASDPLAKKMSAMLGEEEPTGEIGVCNLAAVCLGNYVRLSAAANPDDRVPVDGLGLPIRLPSEEEYRAARYDTRAPTEDGAALSLLLAARVGAAIDWVQLVVDAGLLAGNLDHVIDLNVDPTYSKDGGRSNRRHRPVGIGILGLADLFAVLGLVWGEPAAIEIDRALSAAVYFGAACASADRAADLTVRNAAGEIVARGDFPSAVLGHGAPSLNGKLQPDLWAERAACDGSGGELAAGWEDAIARVTGDAVTAAHWTELRGKASSTGLRNCYLTAQMPTASTSNVAGQSEAFYPFTANVYQRRVLDGTFTIVNPHLVRDLRHAGLWDEGIVRELLQNEGSVQGLATIPLALRRRYKTTREIDYRVPIVHAGRRGRGPFICQSASMNHFGETWNLTKIRTRDVWSRREGLKTASYYTHSQPVSGGRKMTIAGRAPAVAAPEPPLAAAGGAGGAAAAGSVAEVLAKKVVLFDGAPLRCEPGTDCEACAM